MSKTKISATQRFEILRRCNYTCSYCGASAPSVELHIDHARPRAGFGEPPSLNGFTAACADCNIGKGSLDLKTGRRCSSNIKLQDGDVVAAHARILAGESRAKVAADYGVSVGCIHYRRSMLGLEKIPRSLGRNTRKFSDKDVLSAAALVRQGLSYEEAGQRFGINGKALGWRMRKMGLVRGIRSDFSLTSAWGF